MLVPGESTDVPACSGRSLPDCHLSADKEDAFLIF
jgi:hypothetical protein